MSAFDAVDGSIHRHIGAMAGQEPSTHDGGYCFSGAAILVRGWGSAES